MFQDINHLLGLMGENYPYKYFLMKTFSIRWNTLNSDLHSKAKPTKRLWEMLLHSLKNIKCDLLSILLIYNDARNFLKQFGYEFGYKFNLGPA